MWTWWNNLSPRDRSWIAIGAALLLALFMGRFHDDGTTSSTYAEETADSRYVKEAERAGYKGAEAERIAIEAKRLCEATNGKDC
jgi:hypothetical protein